MSSIDREHVAGTAPKQRGGRATSRALRAFTRRPVVLGAVATLLCGPWLSSNQSDRTIYGAGTNSCAHWTETRKGNDWFTAGQWVLGFVSAANQYSRTPPAASNARTIAEWVDNYCQKHPADDLSDASQALVTFLLTSSQR